MNQISVSLEVLANVLGTSSGALSDALKAGDKDEEWKSQSEIDTYVKSALNGKFKTVRKDGYDEGHGRGTRESLSEREKQIREKYSLKGQNLDELIDELVTVTKEQNKGSELDEETIKASPVFQDVVKKLQAKDQEIKTIQNDIRMKDLKSSVSEIAMKVLDTPENKFLLPEEKEIKEAQLNLFLDRLFKDDWKKDGENLFPLKDGKPLQDDSFNEISAKEYIKSLALKTFPQLKGEARTAPGAETKPPDAGSDGKTFTFPAFDSKESAYAHLYSLTDPQEMDAFGKHVQTLEAAGSLK